jgi:hypothetical protein
MNAERQCSVVIPESCEAKCVFYESRVQMSEVGINFNGRMERKGERAAIVFRMQGAIPNDTREPKRA